MIPEPVHSAVEILFLADKALYKSKDGSRDQISLNKEAYEKTPVIFLQMTAFVCAMDLISSLFVFSTVGTGPDRLFYF